MWRSQMTHRISIPQVGIISNDDTVWILLPEIPRSKTGQLGLDPSQEFCKVIICEVDQALRGSSHSTDICQVYQNRWCCRAAQDQHFGLTWRMMSSCADFLPSLACLERTGLPNMRKWSSSSGRSISGLASKPESCPLLCYKICPSLNCSIQNNCFTVYPHSKANPYQSC